VVAHVFADQPMWAMRVAKQGLGAQTPYQSVSADRLTTMLRPLLTGEAKARCAAAAARMTAENAVGGVVKLIETD
jgi:UDP:flavonoid glycosyltransferase YjiC (YdhE family)